MNLRRLTLTALLSLAGFYLLLILSLLYFLQGSEALGTLLSARVLYSLRLSLLCASGASLFSLLLGLPAAYALSRHRFPGRRLVDTLLELPLVVSPAALGAMILIFFNTPLAEKWKALFVLALPGIVLAQFATVAGLCVRLLKAALDEIPTRYEEVARSLGATPLRAFLTVTLPLCRRGLLSALVLTWAKALGEFGATFTVAGSMPFRTETLPIAIYLHLSSADLQAAALLTLVLVITGLGILYLVRVLGRA
ncbi:ABC transporter permease [Thermosulfurimonas marina]|uniref:ABC transporter permease n=1 Tax=Thermosulfurimonas marina TaxID=2047767 RepID=A0A6H1WQI4_9BACT|nr:ABC transporter permease [Thermosulfurimonas marina]QJA05443.1 ABC transporter permease [Thermosulfurimonas marina]